MAAECQTTYRQVLDAFARGIDAEPDAAAFQEMSDLMARWIYLAMTRNLITGSIGGYSSWLHYLWADRAHGFAPLALSYLKLMREADLLDKGGPSLEALLRALRDRDAIRDYLKRAENALNAGLAPHLEEGAAVMFGRVTGIISARGGWFQADIVDVIGWDGLMALELKVERAGSVLGVEQRILDWAAGVGVDRSHRLLDLLTKPGRVFPAGGHPKAGRLLEMKGGPVLDQAQVWKYLGLFGDLDDGANGSMAGQLRFVVNMPTVVDPGDPGDLMQENIKRIWQGLQTPQFLERHPNADDLVGRLFASLAIDLAPADLASTPFDGLDARTRVALQRLVIERPVDIPVLDRFYRPPGMPGLPESELLGAGQ